MEEIIRKRLSNREKVITDAKNFIKCISRILKVKDAVLFGSYARRDFNIWSDVDILIIVKNDLPSNPLDRIELVIECLKKYPFIEPITLKDDEYRKLKMKKNPLTIDVERDDIS